MSIAPQMEARVNFPPFVQSAAPVGLPPDPRIGHYLPPSSNKYVQIHTGIVWDSQFVDIKTSPTLLKCLGGTAWSRFNEKPANAMCQDEFVFLMANPNLEALKQKYYFENIALYICSS